MFYIRVRSGSKSGGNRMIVAIDVYRLLKDDMLFLNHYNRVLDSRRVNYLALNFNVDNCQMLTVADIRKGAPTIVDGQHRFQALKTMYENNRIHPGDMQICLEIFTCVTSVEYNDLLKAVNDRLHFDSSTIDTNRVPEIIRLLNMKYNYHGRELIQEPGKTIARPLLGSVKFQTELMSRKKYIDSFSAVVIVDLIVKINDFLLTLPTEKWSISTVNAINLIRKAQEMKCALGVDIKLSWLSLLDHDPESWPEVWSKKFELSNSIKKSHSKKSKNIEVKETPKMETEGTTQPE